MVTNALLGEGMSSRLYQMIREKHGLAYSVYSFVSLLSDTGVFGTYLGTDRKNITAAVDLVFHELEKLKKRPVSRGRAPTHKVADQGHTHARPGEYVRQNDTTRQRGTVSGVSTSRLTPS